MTVDIERLQRKFGDAILEVVPASTTNGGIPALIVNPAKLVEIGEFLRDDAELAFNMPIDNTAVDYLGKRTPRFEVIWQLYSLTKGTRITLKIRVDETEPSCASLTPVWKGFNWHERETYDMYGIRFIGHPNLKRLLMYEPFEGHPLRKDYPMDKRQPLIEMRNVRDVPTQRHPTKAMLNRPS